MNYLLKKIFDEGYIYDGLKIVPWCPRCGTGLASHEVAQGYEEVDANTVIVPFKKKDEEGDEGKDTLYAVTLLKLFLSSDLTMMLTLQKLPSKLLHIKLSKKHSSKLLLLYLNQSCQ